MYKRNYRKKSYGKRYYKKRIYKQRFKPYTNLPIAPKPWKLAKWVPTALEKANTALSIASGVAGLLNVEYKVFDATSSGSLNSGPGTVIHLTPIEAGDGGQNRNGNSVKLKSVLVQGSVQRHASDTSNAMYACFAVVQLKTQPTVTPVTQAEVFTSFNDYTLRNLENTKNIQLLAFKRVQLNLNTEGNKRFKIYIPMSSKIKWNSNFSATIPKENPVYIIMWAVGYSSTNTPSYGYQSRVRFIDN